MKIKDYFLTQEIFEIQETEIAGILKTSPIPKNLDKYYKSNKYISHHQDSGSIKERVYKFFQKFNLNYKRNILASEIGIGLKILDYGCGTADFVKFLEDEYITYGYEPNEEAKNFAKQKSPKTIFVSDPELKEIPDGSLDIITLWHVFEHIEDREKDISYFLQKTKTHRRATHNCCTKPYFLRWAKV